MILTCPNCATRYVVGDDAVSSAGRSVRCANCGERWRATPEADAPLELAPTSPPATAVSAPGFGRAADAAPVSKAFRQQAQDRRRTRQALATGVVFAVISALVVILVLALVLFPVAVVRMIPRMAGVYAALKHPVNPTGLALEAQGEPGLAAGQPVLVVHGVERDVEARPRAATPLRISLYDKAGRAVATQILRLDAIPIAPGDARAFHATFTDPPLSAVEFGVELAFDLPALRAPPRGGAHQAFEARPPARAPARAARAAEPVSEARPLAPGSPYALPAAPPADPHG